MASDRPAAKSSQPGRVSVDLGEVRPKVEDVCRRLNIQLSDFVRDAVNLHLESELRREPQWRERALLYLLQAVDNLLRRTPTTVLPRQKMMKVLLPLQEAEDDLARRVYGRLGGIGHGGGLEKTSRYPDKQLFPWEWPALELLIETIDRDEPLYLPITGPNKGTLPARSPESGEHQTSGASMAGGDRKASRKRRAKPGKKLK
jgi:hypothetical protein